MAKQTIVRLRDDIDGTEASKTVVFGWAGSAYEIDLNEKNAEQFAQAVEPYLNVARRVGSTTRRKQATKRAGRAARGEVSDVRAWAANNGYNLSERGRIPNAVIEAYNAAAHSANGTSGTSTAPARKSAKKTAAKKTAAKKSASARNAAPRKAAKKSAGRSAR